jgi:hypothetical protein
LKLFCTVLNVIALLAVLLIGAVSVHAESVGHEHPHVAGAPEIVAAANHSDLQDDSRSPVEPAMHCGAAILGLEALRVDCAVRVTVVDFYPDLIPALSDSMFESLRPPRA